MDSLCTAVEDRVQNIVGDLIEPLETYQRHYDDECNTAIQNSSKFWASYQEAISCSLDSRDRYFYLKKEAEKQEVCIEEAMLAHERGLISVEKVQRINKKGVNIKYKAEIASQNYRESMDDLNAIIAQFPSSYSPNLVQL